MRVAVYSFVLLIGACSSPTLDLEGRLCGAEETCVDGFVCNPVTQRCGRPVEVNCDGGGLCPEEVMSSSPCEEPESFVPCVSGVDDCSQGCRTCQADGTWSECSDRANEAPGQSELCGDDEDNDGDGLVDEEGAEGCTAFFADRDSDGFGDAGDTRCLCAASGEFTSTDSTDCNDADAKVWDRCDTCVDSDLDDFFVGCNDYPDTITEDCDDSNDTLTNNCVDCVDVDGDGTVSGCGSPAFWDCNDIDPNVWISCDTCVDGDSDGAFSGCDAYVTVTEDCSDTDPDNSTGCATCVDMDLDDRFVGCDRYIDRALDCDDDNTDVWSTCGSCVDSDSDGAFVGCDRYTVLTEDCDDDDNPNAITRCDTCVDNDGDGAFVGCDQYVTVDEDCDDDPQSCGALCFPGATEWCNRTDNDCGGDGAANCTLMIDPTNFDTLDVCQSSRDLVFDSDVLFDTDSGSALFVDIDPPIETTYANQRVVTQGSGEPGIRLLFAGSVRIGAGAQFRAVGDNALAIIACDEIRIDGRLNASAVEQLGGPGGYDGDQFGQSANAGPGAGQRGEANGEAFSGGAGAGHCGTGGDGGAAVFQSVSSGFRVNGGEAGSAYQGLSPFLGGSGGASGGPFVEGARFGGGGGGAVHLVAGHRIWVSGTIEANGAGGRTGTEVSSSGGGAGSGGTVLLEAPILVLTGESFVSANGGGGGGGQRGGTLFDNPGEDGRVSDDPALGGIGPSGDNEDGNGGSGNSGNNPNGNDGVQDDFSGSGPIRGGGGGGAGGVIQLNAQVPFLGERSSPDRTGCDACCTEGGTIETRPIDNP